MYSIDFKVFRKVNNFTQKRLADYFGIVQSFMSNMENGVDPIPEKYIIKILDDPSVDSSMVKVINEDDEVKMPREVFEKISQLIDANCSQKADISNLIETVRSQQQTIEHYVLQDRRRTVQVDDGVECVDAK